MMDINQIVDGCKSGDRNSQKQLFEMLYGKMMVVVKRYIKDESLAKDIVSESFIKIFKSIKTFNYQGNLEFWVRKIVVNTTIDYIRKNKKNFFLEQVCDEKMQLEISDSFDLFDISAEEYLEIIQGLSPVYRTVFNMRVFEEMSHKNIAKILGVTESSSKSNYFKAKAIIKNRIIDLAKKKQAKEEASKELCKIIDTEK